MANERKSGNVVKYSYPSQFGSHKSMLDEGKTAELNDKSLAVCVDAYGEYITEKSRLDDGLADPNRCKFERIKNII